MKTLSTKREIADYVNIKRVTTVRIDLAESDDYGLKSQKIVIDNGVFRDGHPYMIHAEIRAFYDEKKFTIRSYGSCISDSFGYYDLEEMIAYRNAPVVNPDSDVVLAIIDSKSKTAYKPVVLHTGKHISSQCTTPLRFIDDDNDASKFLNHVNTKYNKDWY